MPINNYFLIHLSTIYELKIKTKQWIIQSAKFINNNLVANSKVQL